MSGTLSELGLLGWRDACAAIAAPAVSSWIPGDAVEQWRALLSAWQRAGKLFRFHFAERFHAPSVEAHQLFTGKHIGAPIHLLVKVQVHPQHLLDSEHWEAPRAWLREPVLNRLPLALWIMGPVADVRVLIAHPAGAFAAVILLRHAHPGRLSILELGVSQELISSGEPALGDRFECTGTDGFIRVNGIYQTARHAPRIEVHRGALELVRRDLPRSFESIAACAEREAPRIAAQSAESYRLAAQYLDACARITAAIPV